MNNFYRNSPQIITGITAPANDSLNISRFIVLLNKFLGLSRFVFPVTDTQEGTVFTFDFFEVESEILVKVFKDLREESLSKYDRYVPKGDVLYIIDATDMGWPCDGCGEAHFELLPVEVMDVAKRFSAFVALDEQLWEYNDTEDEWIQVPSIAKQIMTELAEEWE